jgi:hypothetical protein
MIDMSAPSEPLPDGVLAEIRFRQIGSETQGIWVRPGTIGSQSFSDVLGVSVPVDLRGVDPVEIGTERLRRRSDQP